jgi:hypothetical protein
VWSGSLYDQRRERDYATARSLGFEKDVVKVGCRNCEVCGIEIQNQKKNKWFKRLFFAISAYPSVSIKRWHASVQYEQKPGSVHFATVTVHNSDYPGVGVVTDKELHRLNKDPDFREYTWRAFKPRLQRWMKRARKREEHSFKYVIFIEFGSKGTNRIHAHIFFFVPGSVSHGADFTRRMLEDWQQHHPGVEQVHKAYLDDGMAAAYASLYSAKTIQQHRIMSSQFDWENFLTKCQCFLYNIKYTLEPTLTPHDHYKEQVVGGYTQWHVVAEGVTMESVREHGLKGLSSWLDGLLDLGRVETVSKQLQPKGFKKWQLQPKTDYTSNRILQGIQKLPPGCLVRMVPSSPVPQMLKAPLITNLLWVLPEAREMARLGLLSVLAYGPEVLFKVLIQLSAYYRRNAMGSTVPHRLS